MARALAILTALAKSESSAYAATSVTTRYQYNADGALTAVTTRRDDGAASIAYLTWDDFTPRADDPTVGALHAGDGNLLGIGARPGRGEWRLALSYDQRDRLVGCTAAGHPAVTYTYHPASLMASSTLASGDALQFHYGNGSAPLMLDLRQPSTDTSASFLGPVYYLSDGREQVLLGPRKDTAGVYVPGGESLTPYAYDPYGAPLREPGPAPPNGDAYDLGRNPFRYAGEYVDPTCGAYYLRTRWYLAALATFFSRDRGNPLQRYGYTGGNPITRTDPTGLSWRTSFKRDVDRRFLAKIGLGATALSLVPGVGEAVFGLQLAANAGAYFHSWKDLAMVGLGAAAAVSEPLEIGRDLGTGATLFAGRSLAAERYLSHPFYTRLAVDAVVGGGQSVIAGFGGARHTRFDPVAFGENMGVTAAWMLIGRAGAGAGYRPYNLSARDVDALAAKHFPPVELDPSLESSEPGAQPVLVFRMRTKISGTPAAFTSPLLEATRTGAYHEVLVGVGRADVSFADLGWFRFDENTAGYARHAQRTLLTGGRTPTAALASGRGEVGQFGFVGAYPDSSAVRREFFEGNPLGVPSAVEQRLRLQKGESLSEGPYSLWTANCHHHAQGILQQLGSPQ